MGHEKEKYSEVTPELVLVSILPLIVYVYLFLSLYPITFEPINNIPPTIVITLGVCGLPWFFPFRVFHIKSCVFVLVFSAISIFAHEIEENDTRMGCYQTRCRGPWC